MHPAFSVIVFTTLSGAGYGLAALLGLGLAGEELIVAKVGYPLALVLIGVGLLSSTLHLGNPKNAVNAFSQWRTSWLSREGVLAVATFIPLTLSAAAALFLDRSIGWLGLAVALLSLATVFCTGMIYANLRTIRLWNTWLTPAGYVGFALAGGAILLAALLAVFVHTSENVTKLTLIVLVGAWIIKWAWLKRRDGGYGASSAATATGLGHLGRVRLLERPHQTDNYLTREMGFRVARKHADLLMKIAVLAGLIIPAVLLALALVLPPAPASLLMIIAVISHILGMMSERWLFFAMARHVVSLYYD